MPDENRVFDVARPGRTAPEPTSKPVIVGHHPTLSDPMVKEEGQQVDFGTEATPTKISIQDEAPAEHHSELRIEPSTTDGEPKPEASDWSPPAPTPQPEEPAPPGLEVPAPEPPRPENPMPEAEPTDGPEPAENSPAEPTADEPAEGHSENALSDIAPGDTAPEPELGPMDHVEALHFEPRHSKGRGKWVALIILILLAGGYLAIDAGIIASGVKLPYHFFTQKTETPTAAPPATTQNNTAPAAALPAGFTKYNLSETDITFAALTAWGQPTSTKEDGFSARSSTSKTDGVYAFLVSFAANKDVQLVVTSSKYLPAARATTYYDYLQWCTGTNDGKIYKSLLHFTTANGVETPSTITCDQGPLTDATKLDTTSIVQLKTKDASGAVIGDLYTKNLTNTTLPVFRVKDAAMTNGDAIKQLLATVK